MRHPLELTCKLLLLADGTVMTYTVEGGTDSIKDWVSKESKDKRGKFERICDSCLNDMAKCKVLFCWLCGSNYYTSIHP